MLLFVIGHPRDPREIILKRLRSGQEAFLAGKRVSQAIQSLPTVAYRAGPSTLRLNLPVRQFSNNTLINIQTFVGKPDPVNYPDIFLLYAEEDYTTWGIDNMIDVLKQIFEKSLIESWSLTEGGIILFHANQANDKTPCTELEEWVGTGPSKLGRPDYGFITMRFDQATNTNRVKQTIYRYHYPESGVSFQKASADWLRTVAPTLEVY